MNRKSSTQVNPYNSHHIYIQRKSRLTSAILIRTSSTEILFIECHFVYIFAATIMTVGIRIIHMPMLSPGPRFSADNIAIVQERILVSAIIQLELENNTEAQKDTNCMSINFNAITNRKLLLRSRCHGHEYLDK